MEKIKAFLATPLGKFVLDIVDSAVLGAAFVAVSLPGDATTKEALGLIVGGAVGAVKATARLALLAFIASRKDANDPAATPTTPAQ